MTICFVVGSCAWIRRHRDFKPRPAFGEQNVSKLLRFFISFLSSQGTLDWLFIIVYPDELDLDAPNSTPTLLEVILNLQVRTWIHEHTVCSIVLVRSFVAIGGFLVINEGRLIVKVLTMYSSHAHTQTHTHNVDARSMGKLKW
jgi:hypothetical protein